MSQRDFTPKYVIKMYTRNGVSTSAWRGRASGILLDTYVSQYVKSLAPGGCNERIAATFGYASELPYKAEICYNSMYGDSVVTWQAKA